MQTERGKHLHSHTERESQRLRKLLISCWHNHLPGEPCSQASAQQHPPPGPGSASAKGSCHTRHGKPRQGTHALGMPAPQWGWTDRQTAVRRAGELTPGLQVSHGALAPFQASEERRSLHGMFCCCPQQRCSWVIPSHPLEGLAGPENIAKASATSPLAHHQQMSCRTGCNSQTVTSHSTAHPQPRPPLVLQRSQRPGRALFLAAVPRLAVVRGPQQPPFSGD